MENLFKLHTSFKATGDQPVALNALTQGILRNEKFQTLLGVTGSGKTFTIANVIEKINQPTLVLAPNKTLAAQLYKEYKTFFPENRVEYFVSYYDYYQPESYVKKTDTYIEKEVAINDEIDRMRYSAIASLVTRRDTIVVASVSAIYNLGDPKSYKTSSIMISAQSDINKRGLIIQKLIDMKYTRSDLVLERGCFLVKGESIEIFPMYMQVAYRLEFYDEDIERLVIIDPLLKKVEKVIPEVWLLPNTFYSVAKETIDTICDAIHEEKNHQVAYFQQHNKLIEAQRIEERVNYDCEMLKEVGYCKGIENYSHYLSDRPIGAAPYSLIDFFPKDFLLVVDESHIAIPQVRGMYNGDRSRKQSLVENGFRLPTALENRPLKFDEFMEKIAHGIFVSATPTEFEIECSGGSYIEQIIRPTGILDPVIEILPTKHQIDTLLSLMQDRIANHEKILVTTLTKKLAEEITNYYSEIGLRVRYLHSDVDTLDRIKLLEDFRNDVFDVIIGINLLREGIDIPEVTLVAILEADKEGFLRSYRSLIQTIGRAARNTKGKAVLFADTMTKSIVQAIEETNRRRIIQHAYNIKHDITPTTIIKNQNNLFTDIEFIKEQLGGNSQGKVITKQLTLSKIKELIVDNKKKMLNYAENLNFEKAIELREEIKRLKQLLIEL